MAFQPVPQGVEVVVKGIVSGSDVVNVYHVDAGASPSDAALDEIVGIFENWMLTDLLPVMNAAYALNTITATDISAEGGHQVVRNYTTGNTGGLTGAPFANNSAMVISWRTLRTGRSYRGRTYLGALSISQIADANNVVVGYASGVATIFVQLRTALAAAGYTLSVLSRVLAGVTRIVGVLTEITSLIVDTKIDSQRRRDAN